MGAKFSPLLVSRVMLSTLLNLPEPCFPKWPGNKGPRDEGKLPRLSHRSLRASRETVEEALPLSALFSATERSWLELRITQKMIRRDESQLL